MSKIKLKAETHDTTNGCNTSPRQVAATNHLMWHVKIIVATTEFCLCDLSHKFKLIWIHATYRSDQISPKPCRGSSADEATCCCDVSSRFVASCGLALMIPDRSSLKFFCHGFPCKIFFQKVLLCMNFLLEISQPPSSKKWWSILYEFRIMFPTSLAYLITEPSTAHVVDKPSV